uniref:sensor histidine kinase n=1 Tax=Candidatus Ventrenecus sp. TaxID=3085654 RepID=UPI004026CA61
MKKEKLSLCFFWLIYFTISFIFISKSYICFKKQIILNNEMIVGTVLQNGEANVSDIVAALKKENFTSSNILAQYGLENLESLDYLPSMKKIKQKYFLGGGFITLISAFFFSFLYLKVVRKKQKQYQLLDEYFYNLLYNDQHIHFNKVVDDDFTTVQNDIIKVTRRLQNALANEEKTKNELSKTLADISHQLKTPLTSLAIINDALKYDNILEEQKNVFLKEQERTINHMQILITTLLKVSQIESGMIPLKKELYDLRKVIDNSLLNLDYLITAKELKIEKDIPKSIITMDKYWLGEALTNIIKNACEHSFNGGKISITVKKNPIYVSLEIKDYGEGIKKCDLPHLFERFYCCQNNKDSVGIGLNLTKSILDKMNATVKVKSEYGKYTIFEIHFFEGVI